MADNKVHFLKEILSNPIVIKGRTVPFENVGANRGVVALDPANPADGDLIAGLNDFASRGVGGVAKLTEAEYTEKKSHPVSTPSVRPRELLRARHPGPPQRQVPVPAEAMVQSTAAPAEPPLDLDSLKAVTEPAAPAAEPEAFKPATRRISRKTSSVL